jgi:NadR type nicotinamide-nucleotide adenylyltransferase
VTGRFGHGLVVGKFYPPHAGHNHLIDEAVSHCERLTVIVAASQTESVPLDLRARWLEERHPDARIVPGYDEHPIDYADSAIWDAHMAVFRGLCPEPVDAVFSSEAYGEELARRFDAVHVPVDPGRRTVPISGSAVRADPVRHWHRLEPPIRAWLTRRVVIVGAESTGTTALAQSLAAHYGTVWVPEYGRTLTEQMVASGTPLEAIDWQAVDFAAIARRQQADEDAAALEAAPVMLCDTDAMATCVWRERYVGASTPELEALAGARHYALYILTSDDIPFESDGLRDGPHLRSWMTGRFRDRLAARTEPWIEVRGPHEDRMAAATKAVDALLEAGWEFADPP